jgi:Family of unknown function (DUF6494)
VADGIKMAAMNDVAVKDLAVKAAVDRFLKHVSFTAQKEIEKVVRKALAKGELEPGKPLHAAVTLSSKKVDLDVTIFSKIEL